MRRFINILSEIYSRENLNFLRYMKSEDFYAPQYWYWIAKWFEQNHMLDEASEWFGVEVNDADELYDLMDDAEELWAKVPADVKEACIKGVIELLNNHAPAEAPTWAHASLNRNKLLPRGTWLVHFTDNPWDIANHGFEYGVYDMDMLGLTKYLGDGMKKHGGYNFAFDAESRDANNAASTGVYGKSAVMFQNSGVEIKHFGDMEDQVVFWGKDVDPRGIVVLTKKEYEDEWTVRSRVDIRPNADEPDLLYQGSFKDCVKWVIKNHRQYARYLFGQGKRR